MNKFLATAIFSLLFSLTVVSAAYADTGCVSIYGGGQSCPQSGNISINKTVINPQTNVFVDSLSINDPKFGPDNTVTFQLILKNTGSATLDTVTVKDTLPQFVMFAAGPGNFDQATNTLTFTVNNLAANETRTFTVVGRIVSAPKLPADQSIVCVVNQSFASNNGQTSQDNAQFCIQKTLPTPTPTQVPGQPEQIMTKGGLKVFAPQPVTTTPSTGPEALPLLAMIPTGVLGYFLRKKTTVR